MKELIIKCYEESDGIIPIYQFPKDGMNIPIVGELIRCKDCKHMVEHKGYGYLGESAYTCEGNMGGWIYPNSFCSNAKRKEE